MTVIDPPPEDPPATSTLNPIPSPTKDTTSVIGNNNSILNVYQTPDETIARDIEPNDHYHMASIGVENTSSLLDQFTKISVENNLVELNTTERQKEYWLKQAETYKKLKSPYKNNQTLEEFVNEKVSKGIKIEDVELPKMDIVTDKSMLQSTLKTFDKKYIRESLHRDIAKAILSVQKTGINITNYEVERQQDVSSDTEVHIIQFTPVGGSASTVRLRLPRVSEEGKLRQGMSSYSLRKLRADQN